MESKALYRPAAIDDYTRWSIGLNNDSTGVRRAVLTQFIRALYNSRDFAMTVKDAAEVLHQREDNLLRLLRPPVFVEDRDYRKQTSVAQGRGRPRVTTWLTVDAFKRLCMNGRTKRALEVQRYFSGLEDVVRQRLTEQIEDRLRGEDESVSREKRDRLLSSDYGFQVGPCLYIIKIERGDQAGGRPLHKIGRTLDLNIRFHTLQAQIAGRLQVVFHTLFEDHEYLEVCVHMLLKDYRLWEDESSSEIFAVDIQPVIAAIEKCRAHGISMKAEFKAMRNNKASSVHDIKRRRQAQR